ncbi:MAG: hypothetical protein NTX79_01455 [Candidatus Micrarchaeota archaeon]|nr:hypothetical protein [Candidatus Micrarchaeota archaeon]
MRISRALIVPAAVAAIVITGLFSKPVMVEAAMLASRTDSTKTITRDEAFALVQKNSPNLANWLTGAALERMMARIAGENNLSYNPNAKPKVSSGPSPDEINALYDQVNNYAGLTPAERAELGTKVAASGDGGLIGTYNELKVKYESTLAKTKDTKEEQKAEPTKTSNAENENVTDNVSTPVDAVGALYGQVNQYADLSEGERAELGKKVTASGDANLIDTYKEVKDKYESKPAETAPPKTVAPKESKEEKATVPGEKKEDAGSNAPTQADKDKAALDDLYNRVNGYSGLTETERQKLGEDVEKSGNPELISYYNGTKATYSAKPDETAPPKAVILNENGEKKQNVQPDKIDNTETEKMAPGNKIGEKTEEDQLPDNRLKQVRDSLEIVVNECYTSINAMTQETLAQDSARIKSAIDGIGAVIAKSFPKDDSWANYTMVNLREYFVEICEAKSSGKK